LKEEVYPRIQAIMDRVKAGLPPYELEPEKTPDKPKRPSEPKTTREWNVLLVRANQHIRGTRRAADLNPDWQYDLVQFQEAQEFIAKAEASGHILPDSTLLAIDNWFKRAVNRGPGKNAYHYGSIYGYPQRYAVAVAKRSCRWWFGNYQMHARRRKSRWDQIRRANGMSELEMIIGAIRWGPDDCVAWLEPRCPQCDSNNPIRIKTRKMWKCRECSVQFTIWTRTPFQGSRLPHLTIARALGMMTFYEQSVQVPASAALRQKLHISKFAARRLANILLLHKTDAFVIRLARHFYREWN
jgi:hypothetical protein